MPYRAERARVHLAAWLSVGAPAVLLEDRAEGEERFVDVVLLVLVNAPVLLIFLERKLAFLLPSFLSWMRPLHLHTARVPLSLQQSIDHGVAAEILVGVPATPVWLCLK